MSLDIEKPAPLMIGDKAYYNLTSYDPVKIEVQVPYVTDFDVEMALLSSVAEMGGDPSKLSDAAWLAEHFDGITNQAELRVEMRNRLMQLNGALAEEQKGVRCLEELTKRLRQSVPPAHIARARQGAQFAFEQQLTAEGLTLDQFCARSGVHPGDVSKMLDEQAKQACEQGAALDAYAREKKLSVSEDEFGPLLGISARDMPEALKQARAAGQYEQMKEAALRSKAAQAVIAECSCTYLHETPDEARRRSAQLDELRRQLETGGLSSTKGGKEPGSGSGSAPGANSAGLHLVP